ncbi:hypothetical protein WA026_006679 [Henosepilachna vigintioctopunctata]|uniref:Uncharacterized protein n=1 Tax=Henosepilachna vigintioctopunctata TaxID=420089 RepID=A0AAW1UEZ8_9CUCU
MEDVLSKLDISALQKDPTGFFLTEIKTKVQQASELLDTIYLKNKVIPMSSEPPDIRAGDLSGPSVRTPLIHTCRSTVYLQLVLKMLDDDIALIGVLFATDSNRKRKRSVWCKDWLRKRELFSHVNLLNELRTSPKDWHKYLRMNEETYLILLGKVAPLIEKKDTVLIRSISAHERLTATLRFLATGRTYADMKFST